MSTEIVKVNIPPNSLCVVLLTGFICVFVFLCCISFFSFILFVSQSHHFFVHCMYVCCVLLIKISQSINQSVYQIAGLAKAACTPSLIGVDYHSEHMDSANISIRNSRFNEQVLIVSLRLFDVTETFKFHGHL